MCHDKYGAGTDDLPNAIKDIDFLHAENKNSNLSEAEETFAFNQNEKELKATMDTLLNRVRVVTAKQKAYLQLIYSGHGVKFEKIIGGKSRSDTYAVHADGKSYTNLTKFIRKLGKTPHLKTLAYLDCCRSKPKNDDLNTDEG